MPGKIERCMLRVNLTTNKISREVIAEEDVQMFLGGRVLGDMLLYKEMVAGIAPLSPQNKLLFGTGPLTGTSVPGSSRYIVHTKSPLTGLYLSSLAGGYFGREMKRAGYDIILVEGRAEAPVYLVISDDRVELRDASHFWGMTTGDVQGFIKGELGDSQFRIACIGPAGENLVPYAAIVSERRTAGRGGAGAVMGSKNLKAIAIRGTGKVQAANPGAFKQAVKHAIDGMAKNKMVSEWLPIHGSMQPMPVWAETGIQPWRNWQEAVSPRAKDIFPQTLRERFLVKDVYCAPPCPVKCGKLNLVREGPHAGAFSEGPEYEAVYAFGSCCDISDLAAIIQADELCDKYGLDVISMGVSVAFAMECYEKGIITNEHTEGEELRFGQGDLLPKLIRDTAYRRGFGEVLSQGTKKMAEMFGKGSEAFAMHAKGMELGGYDPRGAKSVALVFACGPRGGCHKSGGSANALSFKELATGDARFLTEGKAALTKGSRQNRVLADSAILCIFPQVGISDDVIAELLNAATGLNWSIDDLYVISERGSNIERAFNIREGLRRSWDTLPPRILTESVGSGPTKGQVVELDALLTDFYRLCGWDIETGIPTPEKLNELGLTEIARDMEGYLQKKLI